MGALTARGGREAVCGKPVFIGDGVDNEDVQGAVVVVAIPQCGEVAGGEVEVVAVVQDFGTRDEGLDARRHQRVVGEVEGCLGGGQGGDLGCARGTDANDRDGEELEGAGAEAIHQGGVVAFLFVAAIDDAVCEAALALVDAPVAVVVDLVGEQLLGAWIHGRVVVVAIPDEGVPAVAVSVEARGHGIVVVVARRSGVDHTAFAFTVFVAVLPRRAIDDAWAAGGQDQAERWEASHGELHRNGRSNPSHREQQRQGPAAGTPWCRLSS